MVMETGYPVKASGVTDALKELYVPISLLSILNLYHGLNPYISYEPGKTNWNYFDFRRTSNKIQNNTVFDLQNYWYS